MQETSSKKLFSTLLIALLLGGVTYAIVAAPTAHAATNHLGIVVPLYAYPTSSTWSAVAQAKHAYPNVPFTAVVNPSSGPGTYQDPNFVQGIKNLQAAGVQVLGYVDTAYGADSISSVEQSVSLWKSWYAVNGIFFDDMSNIAAYESYYATLGNYVSSAGMPISLGNPGTSVPDGYIGTLNVLDIYESGSYPSLSFITYAGYSPSNFAMMAYGVPLNVSFLTSAANLVSWVYVTDATLPNPYSTLPSYFNSEVAALSSIDGTVTASGSTASVSVGSVTLGGASLAGLWTTWSQGGRIVSSGFTPTTFVGAIGGTYTVAVSNYGSDVFCHWQDGTTTPSKSLSLQGNVVLTAYYSTTGSCPAATFPVTINSESTTGLSVSGLYTLVTHNGVTIATGFTPLTFTASASNTYTITVSNYGIYTFSHWSNGSTSPSITVTPSQPTTLVAYYNVA